MTDARATQVGLEVAYAVVPDAQVTQVGLEVAYTVQGPLFKLQACWDRTTTEGAAMWGGPYADLTPRLRNFQARRHAGFPQIGANTLNFVLRNDDLRYTPMNTASPLYPYLDIDPDRGQPVRLLGLWGGVEYPLWYGTMIGCAIELSETPSNRLISFQAESPIARFLRMNVGIDLNGAQVVANDSDRSLAFITQLVNIIPSMLINAEHLEDVKKRFILVESAKALDEDEYVANGYVGGTTAGASLEDLAAITGGMYFDRPVLQTGPIQSPWQLVWKAFSSFGTDPVAGAFNNATTPMERVRIEITKRAMVA